MGSKFFDDVYVPDEGPEGAPILLVGEAPGEDEYENKRPFVGRSGTLLINCLERAGVARDEVRLANLCHFRPYHNKFENLLGSEALKNGIRELGQYIREHRPVVIGTLGKWPLHYLAGIDGITHYRGSILSYLADESLKLIPTFHPAHVARDASVYPIFDIDIRRIVYDSKFPEKRLPKRTFILNPTGTDLEEWTQKLEKAPIVSCDIESVKKSTHILCVGFAPSADLGVCFVPDTPEKERAIQRVLSADNKKIFQFGTFDTLMLGENGYIVNDPTPNQQYYWDTLIAQHVVALELPRSLDYLASIHTREPYYKTSGRGTIPADTKSWNKSVNREALYEYNARDCCVTFEVYEKQLIELAESGQEAQFRFEMELLEVTEHMGRSGMLHDPARRQLLENILLNRWQKKQFILNGLVGEECNVRSPKLKKFLYDKQYLGLPTRRSHDGKITTNEDAIVSLIGYSKGRLAKLVQEKAITDWKVRLAVLQLILEIRGIRQFLSNYILVDYSEDGRIRAMYKVAGTETARWSASKYMDKTGFNPQTMPRDPVEIADDEVTKVDGDVVLKSQLGGDDSDEDDDDDT